METRKDYANYLNLAHNIPFPSLSRPTPENRFKLQKTSRLLVQVDSNYTSIKFIREIKKNLRLKKKNSSFLEK